MNKKRKKRKNIRKLSGQKLVRKKVHGESSVITEKHSSSDNVPANKSKQFVHTIIGLIIGIGGIIIGIGGNRGWFDNQKTKTKERIEERVETIRESFNPEKLVFDSVSNPDIVLMREFQQAAIEYVNYWKHIEAIDAPQLSKDSSPGRIDCLLMKREIEFQINQYKMFSISICDVKRKINAILIYGQQNGIYEIVKNVARWNHMNKGFELIEQINKDAKDTMNKNWKKLERKYGDLDDLPAKELIKAMKPYHDMYNKKETLAFIEELMSYSIDLNANCMNYLNK